jgi:hypothetical protein
MSDLEYFGRVAQKPANPNDDRHAYFTGVKKQAPQTRVEQVVREEVRVRDEDLPPDEY